MGMGTRTFSRQKVQSGVLGNNVLCRNPAVTTETDDVAGSLSCMCRVSWQARN